MTVLSVDWGVAWMLAGICVATVFFILLVLVLVLQIFSMVTKGSSKDVKSQPAAVPAITKAASLATASEEDKAAVATALYLYLNNSHDEESGILTIAQEQDPAWHAVLNPSL